MQKRPDLRANYNTEKHHSNPSNEILKTIHKAPEKSVGNSKMKTTNDININNTNYVKRRNINIDYAVFHTDETNYNSCKFDLKKIPTVNYCKLSYLVNQRVPLKSAIK